jgi:membrane-bound serine protease (ClpP class)
VGASRIISTAFLPFLLALGFAALVGMSTSGVAQSSRPAAGPVLLVDVKGAIGVGTRRLLEDAQAQAVRRNANLILVRLDTPGGLVSATREIIQGILASPVPIAVWVAPSGARAASAGTYIAYAAHISAMAPGTHLGAATPVQLGAPGLPTPAPKSPDKAPAEKGGTAMERKVVNDATAFIRSLAELRGRNAEWAEKAVRDAATLTATEAHKERVVDILASDIGELLAAVEGRKVRLATGERVLAVRNGVVEPFEAGWQVRLLTLITDPNVAFILLMIGVYGILFEFWSPGLTGPGVVGGIALIIALMALSALPISFAGLALLALGAGLMAAEAFAPGFGILGIGGIVSFILGAAFLFDPAGADIDFGVAWPVIISAALTSALLLAGLLGFVVRARSRKVVTGAEEMLGLEGRVIDWDGRRGRIRVHSETWSANGPEGLAPGMAVRVASREGLELVVAPIEERK